MFNYLYDLVFPPRPTVANQVKNLQSNNINLLEIEDGFDLDLEKTQKIRNITKSFIITKGYLNKDKCWTLVCILPAVFDEICKKYILTNFMISNPNYETLEIKIDNNIIINDIHHPWVKQWKHLSNGSSDTSQKNDNSIPYLTFPIPEINGQAIRFEITYDKNVIEDPKDITLNFDLCMFKEKNDETKFFNVWHTKKHMMLSSIKYPTGNPEWILHKNYNYYEMVISVKEKVDDILPIETIKLTNNNNNIYSLDLCKYECIDNFYRIVFSNNYIDGLSGIDWKNIEIIPKINYKDKIENIYILCSNKLQYKNYKFIM